jgi:Outer membrane protein beta-barrel domain
VKRARISFCLAALLALSLSAARPAAAQGFFVAAQGGYFGMAASRTGQAVFGSSGGGTFGGELGYVFSKPFFVAVGARYFKKDGERVFVADATAPVFKLGHPLSMRLVPAYLNLGYRFEGRRIFTPYVGAGAGIVSYKEESTVAGITESDSRSHAAFDVLAGVELGRSALRFGVEASYTSASGVIGMAGVSQVYAEKNAGGFAVTGRIVFTTGRR